VAAAERRASEWDAEAADPCPAAAELPLISCDLPWSAVVEVRLFPMRYARRGDQASTVAAIVPADPGAVLAGVRAGWPRRRVLARSMRIFGMPLSLADRTVDCSAAQIAAVASAFAGVPVRRY
jgi:hypothetical protein